MSGEAYELLAMLMRYVFVALGVVILLRAARQLHKDARAHKKEMKRLPDAGLIGEVVDLDTGKSQPLPREGLMGSGGGCDIHLKRRGVRRRHVLFEFVEGKGLKIKPHFGSKVAMEGVEIKAPAYALHGTNVTLGNAHIRIRLFAGLNVPNPAAFQMDVQPMYGEEEMVYADVPQPFEQVPQAMPVQMPVSRMPWDDAISPDEAVQQPGPQMPGQMAVPALEEEMPDDYVPYASPVVRHRRSERR